MDTTPRPGQHAAWLRRPRLRIRGLTAMGRAALIAVAALALAAAGLIGGHRLRDDEVVALRQERYDGVVALRQELDDARAVASTADRAAAANEAEARQLTGRVNELSGEVSRLQSELEARDRALASVDAEVGAINDLSAALIEAGRREAELQERYGALVLEHEQLAAAWSNVVPIDTPDLTTDLLFVDLSSPDVFVTRPVCSGSMEPDITCDDLLILYEPESISDLDVGDIIYFRRQNATCTGYLEGRWMLHRVINVVASSNGVRFQTQGDALATPDYCLVPAEDVLFKLLTSIHDSRIRE